MKELSELLLRPIQHILRKQSAARTKLLNFNLLGRAQHPPHFIKLPREQPSEDRVYIARRIEVARFAKLLSVP